MCGQVIKKKKVNRKFCGETTVFPKYGAGTIRNSNVINTLQSIHNLTLYANISRL